MNFKTNLLIIVLLMAGSAHAELARSSRQSQGAVAVGDCVFVERENVYKALDESNNLKLIPLEEALANYKCPRRRNIAEIEEAYADLSYVVVELTE